MKDIKGYVQDFETHKPLSGARVCLKIKFSPQLMVYHEEGRYKTVAAEGMFRFPHLPMHTSSDFEFCVDKDGYYPSIIYGGAVNLRKDYVYVIELQRKLIPPLPFGTVDLKEAIFRNNKEAIFLGFVGNKLQIVEQKAKADITLLYSLLSAGRTSPGVTIFSASPPYAGKYLFGIATEEKGGVAVDPNCPMGFEKLRDCSRLAFFPRRKIEVRANGVPLYSTYLVRTRDGKKYAAMTTNGDSVTWIFQPNGSTIVRGSQMDDCGSACLSCKEDPGCKEYDEKGYERIKNLKY